MSKKVMISANGQDWQEVKPWNPYTYEYGATIEYGDGSVEEISDQDLQGMLPFGHSLQDFIKDKESE